MDQQQIVFIVFQVIVFLFAISVHESAHAWTAYRLGDPTAYMLGRVTLNPVKHIDLFGTIILPGVLMLTGAPVFGWAKPTPVNSRHFKNVVRDDILVSIAGPISNFLIATAAVAALAVISMSSAHGHEIVQSLSRHGAVLDTTSVLMPISLMLFSAIVVNVILAVFNLIPLPPLDGSHVVRHFLPNGVRESYDRMGLVSMILFFLVGGRVINAIATPIIAVLVNFLR